MKIVFEIRKAVKKHDLQTLAKINIRLTDGRDVFFRTPTKLLINPNYWDDSAFQVKSKVSSANITDADREEINEGVVKIKSFVEQEYKKADKGNLPSDWLKVTLDKYYNPEKHRTEEEILAKQGLQPKLLNELFDRFINELPISEVRKKNNRVIGRALKRYEHFVRKRRGQKDFILDIDKVDEDALKDIWDYLELEHKYYEAHPDLFEETPEKRKPKPRGRNTLIDYMGRIKRFYSWADSERLTTNDPFKHFELGECIYGTPIFPTIAERNKLYETDMSDEPEIAVQRDIFVFQCFCGPRVGDYYKFTPLNIVNGAVEYIANKKFEDNPETLRIPLGSIPLEILERYKDSEREALFPFIFEQDYNEAIKRAFEKAGLDRIVTALETVTNEETGRSSIKPVQKRLYEVASSHMARRTFVGNIYKKTKSERITGSMSGHAPNSKAFKRYSEVDDEMKNEAIDAIQ